MYIINTISVFNFLNNTFIANSLILQQTLVDTKIVCSITSVPTNIRAVRQLGKATT